MTFHRYAILSQTSETTYAPVGEFDGDDSEIEAYADGSPYQIIDDYPDLQPDWYYLTTDGLFHRPVYASKSTVNLVQYDEYGYHTRDAIIIPVADEACFWGFDQYGFPVTYALTEFVPSNTTVNGHTLNDNITISYSDLSGKPSLVSVFNGFTPLTNPKIFTASGTVTSGTVVFHLTADGNSTGTELFPNGPVTSSLNWYVNDAAALYPVSAAWSNSNKTLTLTVNKSAPTGVISLLGLDLLGSPVTAPNGVAVNVSVMGN